jgi:hypothetical protein
MRKRVIKNPSKLISNKLRSHSFAISLIICILAFIFFVIEINFGIQINFDYTGNETYVTTQLPAQSVPTVINGIISSTSVIVGFSGAIIGLLYREFNIRSERFGGAILGLSIAMIYSIFNEYNAFATLAKGGEKFLELSFKYSFTGFISSLFSLFLVFLFVFRIAGKLEKREQETV